MEPFDYTIAAQNPVSAMQEGMIFGQQQRAGEQNMQLAQQQEQRAQTQFGQQNQLFDQAQQDRAMQLKAAMDARAAAERQQQDLIGLSRKIGAGGATYADFAAVSAQHPEMIADIQKMWEGQSAERKDADKANVYKAAAAIKSGNPQIAVDMLNERADAAEAGGDKQEADFSRAMAAGIKADPNAGLVGLGLILQSIDEDANAALFGAGGSQRSVQSAQKFDNGTTITIFRDGSKEVTDAAGNVLDGQDAINAVTAAQANEASTKGANASAATEGRLKATAELGEGASAAVARGTTAGKSQADAVVALPSIIDRASQNLDLIETVMNDPALGSITGNFQGRLPSGIPMLTGGQAGQDLQVKLGQIQGQVFLQAYDDLRGAGAITEQEGAAAKAAIARLSQTVSTSEYKAALAELQGIIRKGVTRARAATGNNDASTAEPPSQDDDAFLKSLGLEP